MDLLFSLLASFIFLLICVNQGIFIIYPLLLTLALFLPLYLKRGFKMRSLLQMAFTSSKKSFSIIAILLLIGILIAIWMAAGTVPGLVYYGIQLIAPQDFILWAFILTSCLSLLIGTSFGTISTIGIALMLVARGSNINLHLVAGAIIAGAYLGDRCSPMSSSAHLVASVTATKIYTNLKNMVRTAYLPLIISLLFYWVLSHFNPVPAINHNFLLEITSIYKVFPIVLLPIFPILILALLRVEVKLTMLVSITIAIAISIYIQGYSWIQILRFALFGYYLPQTTALHDIFRGGGIISMVKVSAIVIVSTALAGLFTETKTLKIVEIYLKKAKTRSELFLGTILIGTASAAFGCTQTIAILLTKQLVQNKYEQEKLDSYQLAIDLENTAVVLSPLIPWNVASFVPTTLLMTDSGFIPYAPYLYLLPLMSLIQFKLNEIKMLKANQ
ncbi:Na+/H+ antiporter NhaC family protein [Candidatus Gracilibacteria bacterium]|nr:Na+/H+ antiporter NhaC family protein [Candidatus Gracilibacteria bacterium]NJP18044.1 Na+/H+ antiporter NhaC family protein [Hydrococcus sp. CRU_1_1]